MEGGGILGNSSCMYEMQTKTLIIGYNLFSHLPNKTKRWLQHHLLADVRNR
jgi:hypothetical protein